MEPYAKYLVSAKHPHPDYVLVDHPISVYRDAGGAGWFCDSPKLGCSKTYQVSDPVDAINKFVAEHGNYMTHSQRVD